MSLTCQRCNTEIPEEAITEQDKIINLGFLLGTKTIRFVKVATCPDCGLEHWIVPDFSHLIDRVVKNLNANSFLWDEEDGWL
jgi:uncharacterized protein with PIN domain